MTKQNYSELIVVLDRSGSMSSIRADMQGGFDSFIAEQKKTPGECRVSLYQFDDVFETVYEGKTLAEVPPLSLVPRGWTALYDAVAKAVDLTGARLASMPEHERPDRVAVLIITDGEENRSYQFNGKDVMKRVKLQRESYSWSFSFLGADESSLKMAEDMGVGAANTVYWTATSAGAGAMFDSMSKGFSSYRLVNDVSTDAFVSQTMYDTSLNNKVKDTITTATDANQ